MILSASGWRGIFSADGEEESRSPLIAEDCKELAHLAACSFALFLREKRGKAQGKETELSIALGMDTRPTGPAIAKELSEGLKISNCKIEWLGIAAAPEIICYARQGECAGFIYISASHNPRGHNGLKFGLKNGGVISAEDNEALLKIFYALKENHANSDLGASAAARQTGLSAAIPCAF